MWAPYDKAKIVHVGVNVFGNNVSPIRLVVTLDHDADIPQIQARRVCLELNAWPPPTIETAQQRPRPWIGLRTANAIHVHRGFLRDIIVVIAGVQDIRQAVQAID